MYYFKRADQDAGRKVFAKAIVKETVYMYQFTIRDIENLCGIKAHTLRIWEQRYAARGAGVRRGRPPTEEPGRSHAQREAGERGEHGEGDLPASHGGHPAITGGRPPEVVRGGRGCE